MSVLYEKHEVTAPPRPRVEDVEAIHGALLDGEYKRAVARNEASSGPAPGGTRSVDKSWADSGRPVQETTLPDFGSAATQAEAPVHDPLRNTPAAQLPIVTLGASCHVITEGCELAGKIVEKEHPFYLVRVARDSAKSCPVAYVHG